MLALSLTTRNQASKATDELRKEMDSKLNYLADHFGQHTNDMKNEIKKDIDDMLSDMMAKMSFFVQKQAQQQHRDPYFDFDNQKPTAASSAKAPDYCGSSGQY